MCYYYLLTSGCKHDYMSYTVISAGEQENYESKFQTLQSAPGGIMFCDIFERLLQVSSMRFWLIQ